MAAVFVEPAEAQDAPLLVYERFDVNRLMVVDARTGRANYELPLYMDNFDYDIWANMLYYAAHNDRSRYVVASARDLTRDERLWTVTIDQPGLADVVALETGVLFIGHQYGTGANNTFTLLDRADGHRLWRITPAMDCWVDAQDIEVYNGRLHMLCEGEVWLLDPAHGQVVEIAEIGPGFVLGFIAAGQMVFMVRDAWEDMTEDGRTYQVEHRYLEGRLLDGYQLVWSLQIPDDVYDLEVFDGDVIYRSGNHVIRLDGEHGQTVWQTTITGDVPSTLLLREQWLLVGSAVGYLHILDAESGALIWEQDVWATIEPRRVHIHPVALLEEQITIYTRHEYLFLGKNGKMVWERPTATPTPMPSIIPTTAPIPAITLSPSDLLPPLPDAHEQWPAVIIDFLNADPANESRLETLLAEWSPADLPTGTFPPFDLHKADLNGDSRDELLVFTASGYLGPPAGWVMVIQQNEAGHFALAWSRPAANPEIVSISDLNGDGRLELVYGDTFYGASQSFVTIVPVGWDGQVFTDLSNEPIASTNVILDQVRIEDTTGDGLPEIIIRGGTYGSAGAGPNRTSTFTITWSGSGFVLLSQVPDLPQPYYFFLLEANQHLVSGDMATAITIYEDSIASEDAIYDANAEHQRAFAEFQLMLAYLLLGDESGAAAWATSGNYPDQLYSEAKQIFWDTLLGSQDWTLAAEAARKRVRLAGFERAQLVPWVGYANIPLSLEEICPCADCLQGSIGSHLGP